jgi:hypothetical protein
MYVAPRHSPTVAVNSNPDDGGQGRSGRAAMPKNPMIHGLIRRQRR